MLRPCPLFVSINAGVLLPHFTDEEAGAPEGLRTCLGFSHPLPPQTLPRLGPVLPSSQKPGSVRACARALPKGPGYARKTLALAPEAPGRGRSPVVLRGSHAHTHPLCASGRHCPKTTAWQQLGGSWQKSQGRQRYQLLSWPWLRTRTGQP